MQSNNIVLSLVVGILFFILFSFYIYYYTGWSKFEMKYGENFKIMNLDVSEAKKIRFKKCIYTIIATDKKTTVSRDVTAIMNNLMTTYDDQGTGSNYTLKFSNPGLTSLTFTVDGVSDKDTITKNSGKVLDKWANSTNVTLVGSYKVYNK